MIFDIYQYAYHSSTMKEEQKIEQMEQELCTIKKLLDAGKGDFMYLMDRYKQLTDRIRAQKLELYAEQGPSGYASSQAICNDDDEDDEENNQSFDIEQ